MNSPRISNLQTKQYLLTFAVIIFVSFLIVFLNVRSVNKVSDSTATLIDKHIAELNEIADLQNLISFYALNLHQYYATQDRNHYELSSSVVDKFETKIKIIDELDVNRNVAQDMNNAMASLLAFAEQFDLEMSKQSGRSWDRLRDHLADAQDSATELTSQLESLSEDIRDDVAEKSTITLTEIKTFSHFQTIFSIALIFTSVIIIFILYGRLKDRTELYQRAYFSDNTGLPNRRKFQEQFSQQVQLNPERFFSILLLNIDQLKLVSGTFGHFMGDKLLVAVTNWLEKILQNQCPGYQLFQFSSTTWLIYLPDTVTVHSVEKVTNALLDIANTPMKLEDREIRMTFSIGVSRFGKNGDSIEELLGNAEIALRQAKKTGGDKACFYSREMNTEAKQWVELDHALSLAIVNNELELFYQPKVESRTGRLVGSEALIRWRHDGELISPGIFIPIAETAGHIYQIGQWVLEEACRQWAEWNNQGFDLPIAINISPNQFQAPDFPKKVSDMLEKYKVPASMLELEVTEEIAVQDPARVSCIMQQLKDVGVSLAIDDFGTGYSSLSQLKELPVDVLKVDRSFVKGIQDSDKDISIIKMIFDLAKEYNFKVVIEGVETKYQCQQLKKFGDLIMQGFLFSKPVPNGDYARIMANKFIEECVSLNQASGIRAGF